MTSGIYAITNIENGKVYIGSTVKLERRLSDHRGALCHGRHRNFHLQAAWDKHGEDAFEFGVLEYLDNQEELHLAEQFWMDVYREENRELYNFGLAARCPRLGRLHSEETKHKMRGPREPHSEEHKRKISKALLGHALSPERCRKLRESWHRWASEKHPDWVECL